MRELQGKRLHKIVEYVYHNVPFYREKLQQMDLTPEELDDRREKYPPEQKTIRKQAQEKHRDKVKNKSKPNGGGQAISDSNLTAKGRKEIIFDSEGVICDASAVGSL